MCAANHLQDLLVTQSEYVKTELLRLREVMVGLEEKAGNMELRVRVAMDDGELTLIAFMVSADISVLHQLLHECNIYITSNH